MKYEVTVYIDVDVIDDYKIYMRKHIQDVVDTNCFSSAEWFQLRSVGRDNYMYGIKSKTME